MRGKESRLSVERMIWPLMILYLMFPEMNDMLRSHFPSFYQERWISLCESLLIKTVTGIPGSWQKNG
jgi:hypothetical protein